MKFPALIASLLADSHRPQDSPEPLSSHPVPTRTSFVLATLVAAWAFTGSLQASTVFTLNLSGTVGVGSLDGESLHDQSFLLEAFFIDQPDLEPTDNVGLFLAELAYVEFENGGVFIFDENEFGLFLQYGPRSGTSDTWFQAYAIPDFTSNAYDNFFGYTDSDTSDAGGAFDGFDAEVLSEFEYASFDLAAAMGGLTNSFGQTLEISEMGPASDGRYSLVATAVPEPSSMIVLSALGAVVCLGRRGRHIGRRA